MKKIITAIVIFISVQTVYSQLKFKDVKTAQDVIDNNIEATGGADRISNIRSETITGDLEIEGRTIGFFVFKNDTMSYKGAEGEAHGQHMILFKSLVTDNYGWDYQLTGLRELSGEELLNRQMDIVTGNINFVLNFSKKGFTAELKGTDTAGGKLCYVVIFSKDGKIIRTDLYDAKTFYLNETIKSDGAKLDFYDYRETGGVYRYFKMEQRAQNDLTILYKNYEFNKPVDPEIFLKPADR